jgi:hypothetical protein
MLKKSLIILSGVIVIFVLVVIIFTSMSKTLDHSSIREDMADNSELEEINIFDEKIFGEEFIFENSLEPERSAGESLGKLTFEEEMTIAEKLASFMALDQVKELTTEEWIQLEEEMKEIGLEELKKMTLGDFIQILRNVKK